MRWMIKSNIQLFVSFLAADGFLSGSSGLTSSLFWLKETVAASVFVDVRDPDSAGSPTKPVEDLMICASFQTTSPEC